ncbi:MAG: DNA repair exonuclease [Planctomycetia bacterium]|nr:DNA repair exonuclease [Planctomycetia bacterium]
MNTMTCFIHTADWQLGKPFSRVADPDRQANLRRQRLDSLDRIGDVARQQQASFVVVAGDVFDSHRPPDRLVSLALERIGRLGLPVYIIPGNHDYGGPGSLWESEHFQRENRELAPNLTVLLAAEPVDRDDAILLPCPLLRRQQLNDPTEWIRQFDFTGCDDRPRIVLAHGSTVNFQGEADEEDEPTQPNFIALDRLTEQLDAIDYIALGDWHGFVQAGEKAWYAGSHETDRFPRPGQLPGQVACVRASRGQPPQIDPVPTGAIRWFEHAETFVAADGPQQLDAALRQLTNKLGVGNAVAKLRLDGHLGLEDHQALTTILDTWAARLAHLRIEHRVAVQPTAAELDALTRRAEDPLIAGVAETLVAEMQAGGDTGEVAAIALAMLHQEVSQPEGRP